MQKAENKMVVTDELVMNRMIVTRDCRVMLDSDMSELYGVTTKRLNEAVKRNAGRFPEDFMFQLTELEKDELVANCDQLKKMKFNI